VGEKYAMVWILGDIIYNIRFISGWWYTYPSEKYEFVSRDDEIPNIWKIKFMFQTTNQMCI